MSVEWLCARCADKEEKKTEPDPVVLRLCTSCKVENYVRPFAHSGEAVVPSDEEVETALEFHAQKMKVLKRATANRKETETEAYKEAEKQVLEAEAVIETPSGPSVPYVPLEVETVEEEPEAPDYDKMTKAELRAELEKRG